MSPDALRTGQESWVGPVSPGQKLHSTSHGARWLGTGGDSSGALGSDPQRLGAGEDHPMQVSIGKRH